MGVGQVYVLDFVERKESLAIDQDRGMNRCKSGVSDPILKIEDLHMLRKVVNAMFGQFVVKVVLFDMLVDVGLKSKAAAFRVKLEALKVLQDLVLHRRGHRLAKEVGVKGTVSLPTVLGLEVLLCVGPCRRFPPVILEDLEDSSVVGQVCRGPKFGFFQGLKKSEVVPLPPVLFKNGSA